MKLSKTQQAVLDQAKADIDRARANTFEGWYYGFRRYSLNDLKESDRIWWKDVYEREKNGIVYTQCNTKTLEKLQKLGLIEIINSANKMRYGIDTVKVLNY